MFRVLRKISLTGQLWTKHTEIHYNVLDKFKESGTILGKPMQTIDVQKYKIEFHEPQTTFDVPIPFFDRRATHKKFKKIEIISQQQQSYNVSFCSAAIFRDLVHKGEKKGSIVEKEISNENPVTIYGCTDGSPNGTIIFNDVREAAAIFNDNQEKLLNRSPFITSPYEWPAFAATLYIDIKFVFPFYAFCLVTTGVLIKSCF